MTWRSGAKPTRFKFCIVAGSCGALHISDFGVIRGDTATANVAVLAGDEVATRFARQSQAVKRTSSHSQVCESLSCRCHANHRLSLRCGGSQFFCISLPISHPNLCYHVFIFSGWCFQVDIYISQIWVITQQLPRRLGGLVEAASWNHYGALTASLNWWILSDWLVINKLCAHMNHLLQQKKEAFIHTSHSDIWRTGAHGIMIHVDAPVLMSPRMLEYYQHAVLWVCVCVRTCAPTGVSLWVCHSVMCILPQ